MIMQKKALDEWAVLYMRNSLEPVMFFCVYYFQFNFLCYLIVCFSLIPSICSMLAELLVLFSIGISLLFVFSFLCFYFFVCVLSKSNVLSVLPDLSDFHI